MIAGTQACNALPGLRQSPSLLGSASGPGTLQMSLLCQCGAGASPTGASFSLTLYS